MNSLPEGSRTGLMVWPRRLARLGLDLAFPIADRLMRSRLRHYVLLALDAVIPIVALWIALSLRFEGSVPEYYRLSFVAVAATLASARVLSSASLRCHRWSFRFAGLFDAARLWGAAALGSGIFLGVTFFSGLQAMPRSVVALELLLSLVGMGVVRFAPRIAATALRDFARTEVPGTLRTVILGAGAAGEMLLRDLQRSDEHPYAVVGFLDDDPAKKGDIIAGKAVLGNLDDLPSVARRFAIENVLIAIPRLEARRLREILDMCGEQKIRFKMLPLSFVYINERITASMLQELQPEDLLPRAEVRFSETGEHANVTGRRVLVTGAAGSIGREICRQLLEAGIGPLVMVDLNENDLYLLGRSFERRFPQAVLHYEVADIRDPGRMVWLFERYRPHDVLHAAAHKHVPLMELAPGEAIKNNVIGTRNVAEAADRTGAERFVLISTDKAVRPTSVMGASKRVAEMVVRGMAKRSATRYCAVRFGNVLGSSGSVVPLFREQIASGGPVTVTDPEVKRYFMTISEAVGLTLRAAYGDYGELCVLDMGEQIRIADLARLMITMAGLAPELDVKIQYTGLRPGDKLYEELMTEHEESTRLVAEKIFVASCPDPPADLAEQVSQLAEAAAAEDPVRITEILRRLVPSYELSHDQVRGVTR